MTRERIKDFKEIILPFFTNYLLKKNYENLGKSDAEEFEKDFSEIIELADKALEQQPCEDTISRQTAILFMTKGEKMEKDVFDFDKKEERMNPTGKKNTSGESVVHAHWVTPYPNKRTGKAYTFVCSNCEKAVFNRRQLSIDELGYAFCPYCGAEMDEEEGK